MWCVNLDWCEPNIFSILHSLTGNVFVDSWQVCVTKKKRKKNDLCKVYTTSCLWTFLGLRLFYFDNSIRRVFFFYHSLNACCSKTHVWTYLLSTWIFVIGLSFSWFFYSFNFIWAFLLINMLLLSKTNK